MKGRITDAYQGRTFHSVAIRSCRGVASQVKSFNYFFGLVLEEVLLHHTDNLSRILQKNISVSEGETSGKHDMKDPTEHEEWTAI